ncbi:hypothetical protein ACFQE0_06780 [Methylobacterium komagatae]|uniref:Uncharacterized protein n=1 Tax=Methylobacterium komagatae TaxID=374425 RepID=A0ABW2BGZ5_9HYPH
MDLADQSTVFILHMIQRLIEVDGMLGDVPHHLQHCGGMGVERHDRLARINLPQPDSLAAHGLRDARSLGHRRRRRLAA